MSDKTRVEDIDRGIYDIIEKEDHKFTTKQGLSEDIIREISKENLQQKNKSRQKLRTDSITKKHTKNVIQIK